MPCPWVVGFSARKPSASSAIYTPKYPDTEWHTSVVAGILENKEYTGTAIINRKTSKSYKDHRKFTKPEADWIVHENAHPAIIDAATWETVQRIRSNRRRITRTCDKGALDGLIYCQDCGERQYWKRNTRGLSDGTKKEYCYYVCKNSRTYSHHPTCTPHSINRADVEQLVLSDLRRVIKIAKLDERRFVEMLSAGSDKAQEKNIRKAKNELAKAGARIAALDRIINKIYEDNVEGKISDERFQTMLSSYESEQTGLKKRTIEIESAINETETQTAKTDKFLRLVRTYTDISELTVEIANEFIEKVIVGEVSYTPAKYKHWARGKAQEVRIVYNYIGDVSEVLGEGWVCEKYSDLHKGKVLFDLHNSLCYGTIE